MTIWRYTRITFVSLFAAMLLFMVADRASGVQTDAYPLTGYWASEHDYRLRILSVDGLEGNPLTIESRTAGVIALGHRDDDTTCFYVPAGVAVFRIGGQR